MPVPVATTHAKGVGNAGATSAVLDTAGPFARAKQTAAATGATTPSDANGSAVPSTFHRESQIVTPPQPTAKYSVETDRLTFKYPGIGGCRGWDLSSLRMSTMQSVASSFFSCTEVLTVCAPLHRRWQATAGRAVRGGGDVDATEARLPVPADRAQWCVTSMHARICWLQHCVSVNSTMR